MQVELVQITTRDGVRLDGSLQLPASTQPKAWPLDGVCMVHGTGGNFYASSLFDTLTEACLAQGCAVLRINTRGHDGISNAVTLKGGRRLGAAYELVDDCRHDLAGWVDWLKARIGARVGLIGHSLGAVKCFYALAHEPALEVACVIGLSPPRLSYSVFCSGPEAEAFLETHRQAEALLQQGRPLAVIDVQLPLPMVIAAAGFVEKYGPDERYDYLRFLGGVRCPALVTLGELETANNMAFRGAAQALSERHAGPSATSVVVISGADHFYSRARAELLTCVKEWLSEPRP